MEPIREVSTPVTLKTFRTKKGEEFILKGTEKPVMQTDMGGVRQNEFNHLKLYKKVQEDGLDTFRLVAQKEEKYTHDVKDNEKFLSKIKKALFDTKTGRITEQSEIALNVGGGKTIECNGDVFKMSGNIATNRPNNTPQVTMDLSKGKLTPMAKRIVKIITK